MRHTFLSPSAVVVRAAGLRIPTERLEVASVAGQCTYCGTPHRGGDPVAPFAPKESFASWSALSCPGSSVICGDCAAVIGEQRLILQWGNAVASTDGLFKLADNISRAHFFLNPPKPPFAMALLTAKQEHVWWRAPVSHSVDMYSVRIGDRIMTIRRAVLAKAHNINRRLNAAISAKTKVKRQIGIYESLAREPGGSDATQNHGIIARHYMDLIRDDVPTLEADVAFLLTLSAGETWALSAMGAIVPPDFKPTALALPDGTVPVVLKAA